MNRCSVDLTMQKQIPIQIMVIRCIEREEFMEEAKAAPKKTQTKLNSYMLNSSQLEFCGEEWEFPMVNN
jgi:hypothetical protein